MISAEGFLNWIFSVAGKIKYILVLEEIILDTCLDGTLQAISPRLPDVLIKKQPIPNRGKARREEGRKLKHLKFPIVLA